MKKQVHGLFLLVIQNYFLIPRCYAPEIHKIIIKWVKKWYNKSYRIIRMAEL